MVLRRGLIPVALLGTVRFVFCLLLRMRQDYPVARPRSRAVLTAWLSGSSAGLVIAGFGSFFFLAVLEEKLFGGALPFLELETLAGDFTPTLHHLISSSHLTSSHLISSHLISSHLISSHLISSHHISPHLISPHLITSHHITPHHITSHHITSHHNHITSHHITSHHITSHHITSHHTSHHIHHITSTHHITSHHITSHHITSHHNSCTTSASGAQIFNADTFCQFFAFLVYITRGVGHC